MWLRRNRCMQLQQDQLASGNKRRGAATAAPPVMVMRAYPQSHHQQNMGVTTTPTAVTPSAAPAADAATYTHLLMNGMNGGIAYVSDDLMSGFLGAYACSVQNDDASISVSEQRSPVFRMHWDVDIHDASAVGKDELVQFVRILQADCKQFFAAYSPEQQHTLMLACVLIRDAVQESDGAWSTGMHVVLPNVWVTSEQALRMRTSNLAALSTACALSRPVWNWNNIIDEQVYLENGLRMPYSHKYKNCPDCGNVKERRIHCTNTQCLKNHGKIDIGRVYRPVTVLWGDGTVHSSLATRVSANPAICLEHCIIRCPLDTQPTPHWEAYVGCPQYVPPPEKKQRRSTAAAGSASASSGKQNYGANGSNGGGATDFAEDRKAFNAQMKKKTPIERDSLQWDCIAQMARRSFPQAPYGEIVIKDAYMNTNQTYYIARTMGRGSSFCMNLGDDHKNNTIYFYITERGICQRCWCRCDTLERRKNGLCRDFKSMPKPLTQNEKQILFGGSGGGRVRQGGDKMMINHVGPNTSDSLLAQLDAISQTFRVRKNELAKEIRRTDQGTPPARKRVKL